ncbi:hypothetical protein [Moorena sp. SIO3B2]|uniref:hypothetical protein n=1 Tax=Moorena sp. SIO3B2 TaxID=2607827 RepID=UPI0025803CC2|nr:hypothetical protein [Moorena sp. SIO3B2]
MVANDAMHRTLAGQGKLLKIPNTKLSIFRTALIMGDQLLAKEVINSVSSVCSEVLCPENSGIKNGAFEFMFSTDGIRYLYYFCKERNVVLHEKLVSWPGRYPRVIFEKLCINNKIKWHFNSSFRPSNKKYGKQLGYTKLSIPRFESDISLVVTEFFKNIQFCDQSVEITKNKIIDIVSMPNKILFIDSIDYYELWSMLKAINQHEDETPGQHSTQLILAGYNGFENILCKDQIWQVSPLNI